MPGADLEQLLQDLPRRGQRLRSDSRREVWRFERSGRPYHLTFYLAPTLLDRLQRRFQGSPALREFQILQQLQKAAVPAVRAVALLLGLTLDGRKGDAVITEALEPAETLDHHLATLPRARHRTLAESLITLVEKLGRARLGHADLRPANLLVHDNTLYLADASAIHPGGMHARDVYRLALNFQPAATRTDLLRAWKRFCPANPIPRRNPLAATHRRRVPRLAFSDNAFFGRLRLGDWSAHVFKQIDLPAPTSPASQLKLTADDWQRAWPILAQRMAAGELEVLKRGRSGEVLGATVELAGRPVELIIKRPRRRYWFRYINEIGRGSRSRRAWKKAWQLIARGVPTAWPLLFAERRRFGYPVECLTISERIPGHTLDSIDWATAHPSRYHLLLRRCGRILRRLEDTGLYLYDAKATNWMVREDPALGPLPILIDTDGVRLVRQPGGGLQRLLRSLRQHPTRPFCDDDALAVLQGYLPFDPPAEQRRRAGLPPLPRPLEALP